MPNPLVRFFSRVVGPLCLTLSLSACPMFAQIKSEVLKDGVEHWYIQQPPSSESYLTRKFAEIYNVVFSDQSARPFGRSIAFLVGVSKYRNLSQLPSVLNDIKDMREFLLNKAGFDEVYVATDDKVNRDLVEGHVKGKLPASMAKEDRLLFYYSGHGGDNKGQTGYMLFGGAQRGQFYGQDVLAVDSLNDWSRELQIQHVLFILDSCASGLGIAEKSGSVDSDVLLIQTLSGNGSRTVLTAGTADEETYAEESREQKGYSIFTKSLLKAFDVRSLSDRSGFITIADLYADVQKEMAAFRAISGKSTTPRIWTLQGLDYQGTFVFLNLHASSARLTREQANALRISSKAGNSDATIQGSGTIEVFSVNPGELYIDGQYKGYIVAGQTLDFKQQDSGLHNVEIKSGTATQLRQVTLRNGSIGHLYLGIKPPIDESGSVPVGALEVRSASGLVGDVFLDTYPVGRLEENGILTIQNVIAGHHDYQIDGSVQTEGNSVEIKPNEVFHSSARPAPPRGISATVK